MSGLFAPVVSQLQNKVSQPSGECRELYSSRLQMPRWYCSMHKNTLYVRGIVTNVSCAFWFHASALLYIPLIVQHGFGL
jgi:hypothetical protein